MKKGATINAHICMHIACMYKGACFVVN